MAAAYHHSAVKIEILSIRILNLIPNPDLTPFFSFAVNYFSVRRPLHRFYVNLSRASPIFYRLVSANSQLHHRVLPGFLNLISNPDLTPFLTLAPLQIFIGFKRFIERGIADELVFALGLSVADQKPVVVEEVDGAVFDL